MLSDPELELPTWSALNAVESSRSCKQPKVAAKLQTSDLPPQEKWKNSTSMVCTCWHALPCVGTHWQEQSTSPRVHTSEALAVATPEDSASYSIRCHIPGVCSSSRCPSPGRRGAVSLLFPEHLVARPAWPATFFGFHGYPCTPKPQTQPIRPMRPHRFRG